MTWFPRAVRYLETKLALLTGETSDAMGTGRAAVLVALDELPQAQDDTNRVIATMVRPLAVVDFTWDKWTSTALEASKLVKATAGNLRSATIRLDATAPTLVYYIQLLNNGSVPTDGAVTHIVAPIKVNHVIGVDDFISLDCTDSCVFASSGIVVVLSTTEFTKTLSGAYLSNTILYK